MRISIFLNITIEYLNCIFSYTLVKLFPSRTEQIKALNILEQPNEGIEILKKSRSLNDSTDVLVPPNELRFVEDIIKKEDILYEIKSHYGRSVIYQLE